MRKIFLAVILAVLMFAGTAAAQYADITISPDYRNTSMWRDDTVSVVFTIENVGNDGRVYISLTDYDNSAYVSTTLSRDNFYLYENERTSVTMTIRTSDAPRGNYTATLRAYYDGRVETATVYINVTDGTHPNYGIELIQESFPNICRSDRGEISYEVRNNTNRTTRVELRSGEFRGVPTYFEPEELWIAPYDSEHVKLIVPATTSIPYNDYSVSVYAETRSGTFSDRANFDIVSCAYPESTEFSLTVSSGCRYIDRGDDVRISYSLRNRTNDDIEVQIALVSDLPTMVDEPVYLDSYEYQSGYFRVNTRNFDTSGKHTIKVHAWTDEYNVEKETCVQIRKEHDSDTGLLNNSLVMEAGSSGVFNLLVTNSGDYDEDYDIEVSNPYPEINVSISDAHFFLAKGASREIPITVSATENADTGDYDLTMVVSNHETFEEVMSFSVFGTVIPPGPPVPGYPALDVVSMPAEIRLNSGEETEFEIVVENTTGVPATNVRISLVDAPTGISAAVQTVDLRAGEIRNITGTITVSEDVPAGLYTASLQFRNADFLTEVPIDVRVDDGGAAADGQFFAGMFSLGGSIALGLIVLIIAIVVVVLISQYAAINKRKQAWESR